MNDKKKFSSNHFNLNFLLTMEILQMVEWNYKLITKLNVILFHVQFQKPRILIGRIRQKNTSRVITVNLLDEIG